ncbi:hypothetical protein GCM10007385_23340 [Tateyamaria omphalii]|nr:hypothetical protein GCM10007385_23340 [Tateyamaria omphalii]
MHCKGLIQTKLRAQPFDILDGAFLSQHVVDGVTDKAEHGKGDKAHNQQYEGGLGDTLENEGNHFLVSQDAKVWSRD